ncbi:ProQ/FinO family protein [Ramlibacter sp. PS4R-6]|uniref:ProQ/FinO family protein n=1 Tax=Ramlibacter sp. PS4R-6 TaxID=3133438 RepID=UPI0030A63E02
MAEETKKKRPFVDARPVLDKLAHAHPQLFGARFLPLKVGIFEELMAAHAGAFTKDELKAALAFHARSTRYLEAVASGAQRHGLDGTPAGAIAPEHVHHAIMEVFKRRKLRSKEDLKPWVVARLVRAIDASGLDRAAYTELVNAKDDESAALLDAAFAEIGARQAKREALRRAFEASGKSVAEFAEMYGLPAADVKEAVG